MAALSGIQILKYLTFKQKSGLMRLKPYKLKKSSKFKNRSLSSAYFIPAYLELN